jgi:PAS domain S-box-containing protein
MMDPAPQPTNADTRNFPRKVQEAVLREKLRLAEERILEQSKELEQSRATIDRERARYQELFDFGPDAYVITDAAGAIRDANAAAGRMLGVEPRLLRGKPLPSFFAEEGLKEYPQQLDKLCDTGHLHDWEIFLQPRNAERIAVSVSIARATGRERDGHRWVLRDISRRSKAESDLRELNRELEHRIASRALQLAEATRAKDALLFAERKAREEAESANRVKADFLALLSHEFRTPLQAIFGYTELLERQIHGPLNETQLRDIQRIQQSQQHLLGLITTILDFARLETAKDVHLHAGATLVDEILCEMEGFIGSQLESRGLSYEYHCTRKDIAAFADPAKLQQIVLNLLANAIKFTPREGHVALECVEDAAVVVIRVTDTGIGIPPDKLEAIFQPFVQIRTTHMRSEGSGLGLAISRKLASAMGGTLTAASTPGAGSTFTLTLPAMKWEARDPAHSTPRASPRSRA